LTVDHVLLPESNGGRLGVHDQAALVDIIYVLKSGIPWGMLSKGLAHRRPRARLQGV
jgi:hypothetical protein